MKATGSSGDAPDDWSLDDIKRYFTLQRFLPKEGGLFGSGWAQSMADQENACTSATRSNFFTTASAGGAKAGQDLSPAAKAAISARERVAREGVPRAKPYFGGRPSTINIGDQTYKEVDDRRANVLVPIGKPYASPAEIAQRRRDLERVQFLAGDPLAAAFYGVASVFTASPQQRDQALAAGAALDGLGAAIAPLAASPRVVPAPGRGQPSPPSLQRPSVRLGELNPKGQATAVEATITKPMLGTGARASRRLTPPGWQGDGNLHNEARAHLLAKSLGGPGGLEKRNFVTLTNRGANSPQMSNFERDVAGKVKNGHVAEFRAQSVYGEGALPPSAVILTAHGAWGAPLAAVIGNPAGLRK